MDWHWMSLANIYYLYLDLHLLIRSVDWVNVWWQVPTTNVPHRKQSLLWKPSVRHLLLAVYSSVPTVTEHAAGSCLSLLEFMYSNHTVQHEAFSYQSFHSAICTYISSVSFHDQELLLYLVLRTIALTECNRISESMGGCLNCLYIWQLWI